MWEMFPTLCLRTGRPSWSLPRADQSPIPRTDNPPLSVGKSDSGIGGSSEMVRLERWRSSLSGLFLPQGGRPTFHAHKTLGAPALSIRIHQESVFEAQRRSRSLLPLSGRSSKLDRDLNSPSRSARLRPTLERLIDEVTDASQSAHGRGANRKLSGHSPLRTTVFSGTPLG